MKWFGKNVLVPFVTACRIIPITTSENWCTGLGGSISTAGNVMFVGATQDNYIRAFNVSNGESYGKRVYLQVGKQHQ
jgi:glucose dehydrogenase